MAEKIHSVAIVLGLDEMYEHKAALGVIKFARARDNWSLSGGDWLPRRARGRASHRIDGIIARITAADELERLKSYRVPIVDIAGSFDDPEVTTVLNDDRLTGYMAGRHLLSLGLNNFLFVGVKKATWSDERLDGMRDALAESAGGADLRVRKASPSWLERGTHTVAIAALLRDLPLPCGVFAANDNLGYNVTVAAAAAGLTVPTDLAVIGVDNDEVFCELARPAMTSIPCDCERIGMEAARMLNAVLEGGPAPKRVTIEPWPVVRRNSTNVRIGDDPVVREVRNFIHGNVGKGINVADVVRAFPLSRRALEMRFNQAGGRTLHDEIRAARLERACRLLEEGKNATEAALGSGFATNQHFHHVFRRYMRMTPTAYSSRVGKCDTVKARRDDAFLPIVPV